MSTDTGTDSETGTDTDTAPAADEEVQAYFTHK